jgi:hypothetical protein
MAKIHLITILLILSLNSCQKNKNFVVLKPTNDTIKINRIVLNRHKNPKGYVENYYIELEDYSKIKKHFIPEFEIIIDDSVYSAQGIKLAYSREEIVKDFFYAYRNKTKLICLDTVDNVEMINISQRYSETDRLYWINKDIVVD